MKQIDHFTGTAGKQQSLKAGVALLLMGVMLTLLPAALQAQVLKTFTQRTSNYSPDMPIYHIKGDYTMIGNTNVTFSDATLAGSTSNNSSAMKYVDVDVDGTTFPTINSSTAALTFSEEFGANPACSEVLYAGLYWTGRDNDNNMERTIIPATTSNSNVYNGETIADYDLTITGSQDSPTFTFSKLGSDPIVLTLSVSGSWGNRRFNLTYNGNTVSGSASFDYESRGYYMKPNQTITLAENITINSIYWHSENAPYVRVTTTETPAYTVSRNRIKIKHENASEYTEMEATLDNIYYSGLNGMTDYQDFYAAYVEVTDYVRQYGLGNYTVADLETHVGNGDNTGWIGGWCMVVVYENSKMKWRDITLFDGFARVDRDDAPEIEIPISGFKTVQVGDINMKLGMVAAEGDAGIPNDGCKIEKQNTGEFSTLTHDGSTNNGGFFNSSIQTGGNYRYPNYGNNTGIDIITLNINSEQNDPNAILYNEQTSTTFQFTSTQDLYFPFLFVMGVDAYIPEAEALSGVMDIDEDDISIDSQTGNYLIDPGKEITFAVEVKNFGTEDIVNAKLEIPLPSTIEYYYAEVDYVYPGINVEGYFDAERYANGVAGWNIDYIPSGYPDTVYARVLLTVKVTEDCYVLASTDEDCELAIEVNGTLEGTSYVNGVYFKKESFISGFADGTGCQGNAIRNDIKVVVNKEDFVNNHCQDQDYTERVVTVCENEFSDSNPIPFMKIYALYPQGSRFFNTETDEEYTEATGFPISLADEDTSSATLIHVQPTSIYSAACTSDLRFILDPDGDSFTAPTLTNSATYCLGAQADSLSRHIINTRPSGIYYRFYKERSNSAVAYVDIVPPTDVEGTDTFYVRQFRENAIGCEDDSLYGPITIKVVSPITFRSSKVSPSCIGDTVIITGIPGGGTWSYDSTLTGITVRDSVLTIYGTSAGTYTVTYKHDDPGTAGYNCTNIFERSYTHQIAATTNPGRLEANQTICQGAQIQPLQIVNHNGHVERWEWTTNQNNENWDTIPNNTSSISSADLGELAVGTYYFKALVKDGNCRAEWTNIDTIEVTNRTAPPPPDVDSVQYACIGIDYTIQPSGGNYQWYEQAIGGWPIGGNNPVNSVTVKITDAWITRYVSEVDNSTNCVSNRVEVQVRPNLEPGEINSGEQRECDLHKPATTIGSDQDAVAYGGTVEYQWYYQVNGDTTFQKIIGAESATYTPSESFMDTEGDYIFIRKAKNSTCDSSQQSRGKWRLVVGKPDASIEAVPGHATICRNGGIELRLRVPASTAYSYQWYRNGDSIPDATGHAYIAIDTGRYTARVTHKASGCSATTPEADAIEVKYDDDAPTASDVTTTLNGCGIAAAQDEPTYSNVKAANDSELGFNISDAITPVDSLKLTLREDVTEAEDLPTGVCYQLVRTYTVTDQCGFYTTFTHTINVVDDVAPSIGDDNLNTTLTSTNCNFTLPDFTDKVRAISSDNCTARDALVITQNVEVGTTYTPGTTPQTVTVTVKDACGNTSTKDIVVTIPAALTVSLEPENETCAGNDGKINYTIAGGTAGTAGYTVVLSDGSANQTANQTATGTNTFTGLKAGTYTVTVTDDHDCVATATATVTIEQINTTLTITAQSQTWNYDGQPHTQPSYKVTFGSEQYSSNIASDNSVTLRNGDVVTATVSGSITNAGTEDNTVENVTVTREGTDVTCYYNIDKVDGTLTIEPKPVTITAASDSKEYDGTPLTNNGYTHTALAEGDVVYSVTVTGSQTVVGSSDNVPSAAVIKNAAGEDVTLSYAITYANGELEVTEKAVTITAADDTKVYDGTALTKDSYTNTDLATGDVIERVTVTGSITEVGTVANVPSDAVIKNADGEDVTESYDITYVNGTLEVTPRPVTLTSATDSKIYDGTPLTNSTVTVGGDGFVTGEGATYDVTGTITNVGSCYNTFTYTLNSNTDANNYTITKIEGTLTILIDSVPPCIGCDPIAGVSCVTIGNQTRTNDENKNYYTHSGTAWDVNATDNSGAVPTLTWTLTGATTASGSTTLDGQKFYIGVTTVTWTAKDPAGNTADCSFNVTVNDTTNPVLTCPTITTVYECLDEVPVPYANYAAFTTAGGTATDNHQINESSFAVTETVVTGCPTTITRTYSIKDMAENEGTCTQVITVEDKTAPALTGTWPANITGQNNCFANRNISGLLSTDSVKALYTDNCGGELTVDSSDVVTGDDCGWTVTRTYTIKDSCGNIVSPAPTMSVSGSDKTAPALTGTWPANITGQDNCLANRIISGLYSNDQVKALYSDCSALTVTSSDTVTGDDCGWTVTRTYTITDACDNSVTKTMSVSGSDQTAPALAGTWPSDSTGQNSCLVNADTTGLKDDSEIKDLYSDCSTITVTHTDTIEGNACGWIVTRTYTITDLCGNTVMPKPTMSVSGSDRTAPVIDSINLNRTLTATNCVFTIPDMRDEVRNISTDCSEITVTQPSAGMVVYPMVAERDTTVNVIVTDICGNYSVKEVIITIPAKVTISATATPAVICNGGTSQLSATAANVVGTAVYAWAPITELSSATIANPTVTLTATGASETVTYTVMVTDDNGCTATATASVTVNPEVVMNTVEDWTLCVGETSQEYVYTSTITDGTVTYGWSNDNSAIGLAASGTGNLPSFEAANATTANLIAEVKVAPTYANNGISCQGDSINFHITVRPSITTPGNVAFTCPADTTVVLSYSECEQFVNIGYPEFVNNMTGMTVNITNDAPAGNIFPEGTTIVTWTATDECGDTLTCTQNVVIQFPSCGDTIADFDGYRYSSVRIGCQCWTGENARSEHYSDGTPVDNFRYYNDSDSLENIYGKLYTWYTAVRVPEGDDTAVPADSIDPLGNSYVQGICPEGWALPTVDEYMLMIANSGDATHAKDGSNLYWLPGYEGQPPFSGFDAYGAGKYNGAIDRYQDLLGKTYFWTTLSGSGSETATTVEINYYCAEGLQTELSKGDGVSIRCIRKR